MIKKIFQLLKKNSNSDKTPASENGQKDLEHFVDYVVRALVDDPNAVIIEVAQGERGMVIQVTCAKDDIGKIIGKNGKTISAIRALVNGAGKRFDKEFNVEVMD